jgi:nitroreductase
MELSSIIYKRKSVRKYTGEPVSDETIASILKFCDRAKPLDPDIKVKAIVVNRDQVRFYLPWKTPQLIAVFSENKPGYLENAGFLFQQVELYLQSIRLGACWLGLGKFRKTEVPQVDGMEFVIFIAFGIPEETQFRSGIAEFQRKSLAEIADLEEPRLECARLAPSSTNSQPWYFTHEGDTIHAFCCEAGFLRNKLLGNMNRIDMGIALAHLYLENAETFRFFSAEPKDIPKGYRYTGSVTL